VAEIQPGIPVSWRAEVARGRADEVGCKLLAESRESELLRRLLGQDLHCHQHPKQPPERRSVRPAFGCQIGSRSGPRGQPLWELELGSDPQALGLPISIDQAHQGRAGVPDLHDEILSM
jgi:hypothetical protein